MEAKQLAPTLITSSHNRMTTSHTCIKRHANEQKTNVASLLPPWADIQLGLACDDPRVLVNPESLASENR